MGEGIPVFGIMLVNGVPAIPQLTAEFPDIGGHLPLFLFWDCLPLQAGKVGRHEARSVAMFNEHCNVDAVLQALVGEVAFGRSRRLLSVSDRRWDLDQRP